MLSVSVLLLAFALAVDAAVAAFALSIVHQELTKNKKRQYGPLIALTFSFFQFFMFWGGSFVGHLFTFSSFGPLFHLGSGLIFLILSIRCLVESFSLENKEVVWGLGALIILAFATSLDAFASGISMGALPKIWIIALMVGGVTFFCCLFSYLFGTFFRNFPDKWLLRLASLIFFFLGGQVFLPMILH